MSMHLVGPHLTNLNYRKHKTKVTKAKMLEWTEGHRLANKENKQLGLPPITLEEYIDALHGRVKRNKSKFVPMKAKVIPGAERSRQDKELYPSLETMDGNTAKPERKVYTGTLIKGIATMHKSNAVPIINDEQAVEISRMRRG